MQWQKAKFLRDAIDNELAHLCDREFWVKAQRPKATPAEHRKGWNCHLDDALYANLAFDHRPVVVSAREVELIGEFCSNPPIIDWDEFIKH